MKIIKLYNSPTWKENSIIMLMRPEKYCFPREVNRKSFWKVIRDKVMNHIINLKEKSWLKHDRMGVKECKGAHIFIQCREKFTALSEHLNSIPTVNIWSKPRVFTCVTTCCVICHIIHVVSLEPEIKCIPQ